VTVWIDAQLSPHLAAWLRARFGIEAAAVRDLGLRDAGDREIYLAARQAGAVVMSKDSDFLRLQEELSPPPQILWVACGNTSNAHLKRLLGATLAPALDLLGQGEALVEIRDPR